MSTIVKMSDYHACEPIKIEVFGDEYKIHQATGDMLNHLASLRKQAEDNIKEMKQRMSEMPDEEKALQALDISINQVKFDIESEEITCICYLGESAFNQIKEKYKVVMGEEMSYVFLKQLSSMVASLANTGKYTPRDEVADKSNFQK